MNDPLRKAIPYIVGLCLLDGVLLGASVTGLVSAIQLDRVRTVAEANLARSEKKWVDCLEFKVVRVGNDVYKCPAEKSVLTAKQLDGLI